MADPNLEEMPNFRGYEFAIIRNGLRIAYEEDDDQVIERLIVAWQADRDNRVTTWNAQQEEEAWQAEEAELEHCLMREQEEQGAAEEAECLQTEEEKKKPKMNTFTPGATVPNVLTLPPSQFTLQKLSTFDYVKLWYFLLLGCQDVAKYHNKSQADDTFSISKVDDHLTIRSIASVCASKNALPDHDLSLPDFLQAKNCFLNHVKQAKWPDSNLNALAKFFWYLEMHPNLQLPLGTKIILTYALQVCQNWHRELKAG